MPDDSLDDFEISNMDNFSHPNEKFSKSNNLLDNNNTKTNVEPIKDKSSKSIEKLTKSASKGNKSAQFSLAYSYDVGANGAPINTERAIHWYMEASLQGHPIAENNLGVLFATGHKGRIARQPAEAMHWYKISSEKGFANAQFHLGLGYMSGDGLEKPNYPKAFEFFKKAAKQGHKHALTNVGAFYMSGRGVARNFRKAEKWLKKGLYKCDVVAAHNLAVMYLHGLGEHADKKTGYMYLDLAQVGTLISEKMSRDAIKSKGTLFNS